MPSPHPGGTSSRQSALQPSPSETLPSSHSSPKLVWTMPSPQTSLRQRLSQPSKELRLPSSHSSAPSRAPSPHSNRQSSEQPSSLTLPPSSHSSPGSRSPLPQSVKQRLPGVGQKKPGST